MLSIVCVYEQPPSCWNAYHNNGAIKWRTKLWGQTWQKANSIIMRRWYVSDSGPKGWVFAMCMAPIVWSRALPTDTISEYDMQLTKWMIRYCTRRIRVSVGPTWAYYKGVPSEPPEGHRGQFGAMSLWRVLWLSLHQLGTLYGRHSRIRIKID